MPGKYVGPSRAHHNRAGLEVLSLVSRECLGAFLLKGLTLLHHMRRKHCQMVDFTHADTQ